MSLRPDPFAFAADILDPPTWEPEGRPPLEPHQQPPVGDWTLWLLEGGRGSGKTEACARYYTTYMRTHPGHRGRIIAPTFADAVEACVTGPSGVLAMDPEIRWLPSHPGGSKLQWPNGAEALVLGTPFPKDVDRLRAGGNRHCLVATTPVLTEDGWKPIATIKTGDRVWTRLGLRSVTRAGMTGTRPTWVLTTIQGRVLRGTGDHPVSTSGGWVNLSTLLPGDNLHTWRSEQHGTASPGTNARTGTTRTPATDYCTAQYGQPHTDPSQPAYSSITATLTRPTTTWATLNSSPASSTPPITPHVSPPRVWLASTAHGSNAEPTREPERAKGATTPSRSSVGTSLASVARRALNASIRQLERAAPTRHGTVSSVRASSVPIFATTCRPVLDRVRAVWPTGLVEPVYDLQVADAHEFIANGLIVHNCDWWEEMAANTQLADAWDQAALGLRMGDHPHSIASTTPRATVAYRELRDQAGVERTHATLFDNPHLPAEWVEQMRARYEGTRLGRQELGGELLEDIPGAMWDRATLDACRVDDHPPLARIVVAVDPAATSTASAADTGIIAAGLARNGHAYVLADRTCHLPPEGWARTAVALYDSLRADRVIAEVNNGGEMVRHTLHTVDDGVPVTMVTASRGKQTRAEPVAALFGNPHHDPPIASKVHLVGGFPELEDQLTTWVPEDAVSPDRLDAMVWALTHLMVGRRQVVDVGPVSVTGRSSFRG